MCVRGKRAKERWRCIRDGGSTRFQELARRDGLDQPNGHAGFPSPMCWASRWWKPGFVVRYVVVPLRQSLRRDR